MTRVDKFAVTVVVAVHGCRQYGLEDVAVLMLGGKLEDVEVKLRLGVAGVLVVVVVQVAAVVAA